MGSLLMTTKKELATVLKHCELRYSCSRLGAFWNALRISLVFANWNIVGSWAAAELSMFDVLLILLTNDRNSTTT